VVAGRGAAVRLSFPIGGRSLMEQNSRWPSKRRRVSGAGVVTAADDDADRDQGDAQRRRRHTQSAMTQGHLLHARRVPNKTPADAV
jgi:hypothetical protein